MKLLVAGSTGYLGGHLVREAAARGHAVRALCRSEAKLGELRGLCAEVFVGQATDDATLDGLCEGVDAVVSSLGNRTFRRKPSPFAVDRDANLNVARRAAAAGLRRFVFVSVLRGAEVRDKVPQIEAREQVVDHLKRGTMPWTIVRPSGFYNDMLETLDLARKGSAWVVGDGSVRFNPIHGADLAAFTLDALEDPGAAGRELPVGGPDLLSQREIAELAFAALGRPPKVRALPLGVLRGLAALTTPFNVNLGSLMSMMAALAEGEAEAPRTGSHHLADFFAEQA